MLNMAEPIKIEPKPALEFPKTYDIEKRLGEGAYGEAYLVVPKADKGKQLVAKYVKRTPDMTHDEYKTAIDRELKTMVNV